MENSICIRWSVDDIKYLGYECTDEEGMAVLEAMKDNHDANYGISWETLDNWCHRFNLKFVG